MIKRNLRTKLRLCGDIGKELNQVGYASNANNSRQAVLEGTRQDALASIFH